MNKRFAGKTGIFLAVSGVIIALALALQLMGLGINPGVDFAGGTLLTFAVGESYDANDVRELLDAAGYSDYRIVKAEPSELPAAPAADETETETEAETTEEPAAEPTEELTEEPIEETEEPAVVASGDKMTGLQLTFPKTDDAAALASEVEGALSAKYASLALIAAENIGPTAGGKLIGDAAIAAIIAIVCALVYIAIRFTLRTAAVTLGIVLHDALILCAFMVFFRWLFPVNASFVAALLATIGFSLVNALVAFDRVREISNKPGYTQSPKAEIAQYAAGANLSRTVIMTVVALVALVCLFVFADSLRAFAFSLMIGMLASVYSSLFLGTQIWAMWMDKANAAKGKKKS